MRPKSKALIIGAGVGGLAAGIALRQAGIDVEVFERSDELHEVGAGISLWPNALYALDKLGLGEAIRSQGTSYEVDGLRSWRGAPLAPASKAMPAVAAPIILHRADLLAALIDAFGIQHIQTGCCCIGWQEDGGVTAKFADGRIARGDLLIGADGLRSVVRTALHGDRPPRYAGCTAWRAVVQFDAQTVRATESWGRGSVFGQVPMSGNRVYWYATKNTPEGQRNDNEKARLLQLFQGWHTPIEELIGATTASALLRNDIYDRPALKRWGRGRVTLLGDAAHPMTPYLGQGACQAIEDAVVLADRLRECDIIAIGLRTYETQRIQRANRIVNRSRLIGRVAQLQHPLAVLVRNGLLKLVSPRLQRRALAEIVGYRV